MPVPPTEEALAAALALDGARMARSCAHAAESAIRSAVALAPSDLDVRVAAYRFYFYNHRLEDAAQHAAEIIVLAARRLNIAIDWRAVRTDEAAFDEPDAVPSIYLQSLLAWGYCMVRLGKEAEGRLALAKVVELDARDRFGAKRLVAIVDRGAESDDAADA